METIYYTPQEVAERLKLRVQTIYDYIRKGRLPAVRLGNRCRIAESDLEAFLMKQRGGLGFDQVREQRKKNEAALRLIEEWMADESGHDEQMWRKLKAVLEQDRLSFRPLFGEEPG